MAAWKSGFVAILALACWLGGSSLLRAEEKPVAAAAAHAPPPSPSLDKGDQAWMLTSSALVLMMTGPGLALFYSGLVRKKNVLGVMMQCLFLMGLMTVIWALYGYSLSFGGSPGETTFSKWIGNSDYVLMKNVQGEFKLVEGKGVVDFPLEGTISRLTHMVYQCMFFIITPALICGAFAERMKFSTLVAFASCGARSSIAHCAIGFGITACWPTGQRYAVLHGALDFAGGTVVHISSGVSAFICALVMGRRLGFGHEQMPPHNLTYTVIGAAMLWVGWFGFNSGSALNASGLAASAFVATHFAAAAGAVPGPS